MYKIEIKNLFTGFRMTCTVIRYKKEGKDIYYRTYYRNEMRDGIISLEDGDILKIEVVA